MLLLCKVVALLHTPMQDKPMGLRSRAQASKYNKGLLMINHPKSTSNDTKKATGFQCVNDLGRGYIVSRNRKVKRNTLLKKKNIVQEIFRAGKSDDLRKIEYLKARHR